MAFFDFLKKKKEIEKIGFEDLASWTENYIKEKGFEKKIVFLKKEIERKINDIRDSLDRLENAKLRNENIPERAKHVMEGNRQSYIQKVNRFLDDVEIPEDYFKVKEFSASLSEKINLFSEETKRSYFVLKEFLRDSVIEVSVKIRDLESISFKFRDELNNKGLGKIEEIKKLYNDFKNSEVLILELKEEERLKEKEFETAKLEEERKIKRLNDLKESRASKEYEDLKEKLENIKKDFNNKRGEIVKCFSVLEKSLKKYKRGSFDEELIDKYLEDPVLGLIDDAELKLIGVLGKLEKGISTLGLKDKKEEKTREVITKLNKEFLSNKRLEIESFNVKKEGVEKNLKNNLIVSDILDHESLLKRARENVEEKERGIEEAKNKISRVKPEVIKKDIKELLDELDVVLE